MPNPNPTKFTPKRRKIIVEALRAGNYKTTAAKLARIHPDSIYRWLEIGKADIQEGKKTAYSKFVEDCEMAEAEFEDEALKAMAKAAREDTRAWAAYMTILERKYPDRYGRRDTLYVEGDVGNRSLTVGIITDKDSRELANKLLEGLADAGPNEPRRLGMGSERDSSTIDGTATEE